MSQISLALYSFRIRERGAHRFQQLDNFDGKNDFYSFLEKYFDHIDKKYKNDLINKRIIRVQNVVKIESLRVFNGIIETGEYGFESDLVDSEKGNLKYKRGIKDAEMLPFYFLTYAPKKDEGIMILQRFGVYGASTIFKQSITEMFKDLYSKDGTVNYTLEINPLVPEKFVKRFIDEGKATKLIFKKFNLPQDIADQFDKRDHIEDDIFIELRVNAKRNKYIPIHDRLEKHLSKNLDRLLEIKGFDYDNVSMEVKLNNNTRTIDLSNMLKFRAYIDVTDEVEIRSSGHPVFTSIDKVAKNLLLDVVKTITPHLDDQDWGELYAVQN